MLGPQLREWESDGRYLKTVLFQHKVFCKDLGNPAAPPCRTLLLLHGFPESSFSFHFGAALASGLNPNPIAWSHWSYPTSAGPILCQDTGRVRNTVRDIFPVRTDRTVNSPFARSCAHN